MYKIRESSEKEKKLLNVFYNGGIFSNAFQWLASRITEHPTGETWYCNKNCATLSLPNVMDYFYTDFN